MHHAPKMASCPVDQGYGSLTSIDTPGGLSKDTDNHRTRCEIPTVDFDSDAGCAGFGAVCECDSKNEASATFPDAGKTPADQSDAFLMLVNNTIRIVSDDLQWLVQSKKGRTTAKSSGWKSRHFCRTRGGLLEVLRRMVGRDGLPDRVANAIQALPACLD